jgi:large subunit ribosomal protein L24
MKLKKGDKVVVIAGKAKGTEGVILRAMPKTDMVLLDGVNLAKRHRRANAQNKKGQIVEIPVPMHVSNVQLLDPKGGKVTRIKIVRGKDGNRTRVAVKSGQELK